MLARAESDRHHLRMLCLALLTFLVNSVFVFLLGELRPRSQCNLKHAWLLRCITFDCALALQLLRHLSHQCLICFPGVTNKALV